MTREEALRQIEEMNSALEASNRLMPSAVLTLFIGGLILLLPAIEIPSQQLTFGMNLGPGRQYILPIIHVVFYMMLFVGLKFVVEKKWPDQKAQAPHPALAETLAFHRPVIFAICGSFLMLGFLGLEQLIYPFFLILFGVLINLYGRFSQTAMSWAGWSYIVVGLVFGAITKNASPSIWVYFNTYLGLSLIYVGISVRKERNAR
jgi:hypothetical protein